MCLGCLGSEFERRCSGTGVHQRELQTQKLQLSAKGGLLKSLALKSLALKSLALKSLGVGFYRFSIDGLKALAYPKNS